MTSPLPPADPLNPVGGRPRLESVDLLRGLVMVLMALDHVRDFFSNVPFDPLDLQKTWPALFMTRWMTHYCAPVFTFLAGTGAYLAWTRGKSKGELCWFLFSRGLWLAFLEVSWVRSLGWQFNFDYHSVGVGTLWSIGWSMVLVAPLVFLPTWAVGTFGLAIIALHNGFDWVKPEDCGSLGWLWTVLHVSRELHPATGYTFAIGYPIIPWVGVVAAGYGFGSYFRLEGLQRRKAIFWTGLSLTLLFVVLRYTNLYGNSIYASSRNWTPQGSALYTLFSFIDCHKYPPSLLYLLMTLGPALLLLSVLDRGTPNWMRPFLVFGRVPLFYYLLHLPLVHGLAVLVAWVRFGHAEWLFNSPFNPSNPPPGNGFGLPVVYLIWVLVVVGLYPVCRWFADLKQRRREAWLSYL